MSRPRKRCQCGKPMEARAFVCRACYLSSARKPIRTRKQTAAEAARELWDYWPIWEHYRRRAA
jgi:NMD protein affecting ribosome stability and mRNA decay